MASAVIMPRQGNTVESVIIARWVKKPGDAVKVGDVLCEVETDKAVMEVESAADGLLLEVFYNAGDTVPVMTNIAVIGAAGEDPAPFRTGAGAAQAASLNMSSAPVPAKPAAPTPALGGQRISGVSPRARTLAQQKGVDVAGLQGTGPEGRVIERDVRAALAAVPATPLARTLMSQQNLQAPALGTGLGGRVTSRDLVALPSPEAADADPASADEVTVIPLLGVRKVTAERMRASLQNSAQLTLNASADARAIQAYRQRLKNSDERMGLRSITINDLVLFAVARTLPHHPDLNATLDLNAEIITQYARVHLGVAVDTPRGLLVPVIPYADALSLKQLSEAASGLAQKSIAGKLTPDEMQGGTFTVTNLGSFGIESFTPVINPPQVAILGVGNINLKPVLSEGEVQHIPHIGLSLTVDHQVVDGAPGARFLRDLASALASFDLLLSI